MIRRVLFFFLVFSLLLLVTACGDAYIQPSDQGGPIASPTAQNKINTPVQAATGKFQEFALPQGHSGLMRPALDKEGHVWFGEMSHNYLGTFNPQSQQFWQQTPPDGKSGLMGIVIAPDDTVWFAEQYANYIGHFSPQTNQYQVYHLPIVKTPDPSNPSQTLSLPSAPNDLALDRHGTLWFTELNTNAIGALNTTTGAIRQYPLPAEKKASMPNPYGITVDPQGIVWFSEASLNRLGRLDPGKGSVQYFTPPNISSPLMELASDAHGRIWATIFANGLLLQFNPATSYFTAYSAPIANNNTGSLYGLTIASSGDVWVADTSENIIARLDMREQRFYAYTIPTPNSLPMGLVEDSQHVIWFTEAGSDKIGRLQP